MRLNKGHQHDHVCVWFSLTDPLHLTRQKKEKKKRRRSIKHAVYSLLYYYDIASDVRFSWKHNYDTAFWGYYKRVPV